MADLIENNDDNVSFASEDDEILHQMQEEEEHEARAVSLYVNAVEFMTPPGYPVAIPVRQIVKIQQTNRNATREGANNFFRVYTVDGHYTTAKTTYNWKDFQDHVFDPIALKERHGDKVGRKDDLLDD